MDAIKFEPESGLALWLPLPTDPQHAFLRLGCEHTVKVGLLSLSAPEGFATDGASIPGCIVWLFPQRYVNQIHRAGVFHDYAYRTQPCSRFQADAMFRAIMDADGVPRFASWVCYMAVRVFAGRVWKKYSKQVDNARRALKFDTKCEGLQAND